MSGREVVAAATQAIHDMTDAERKSLSDSILLRSSANRLSDVRKVFERSLRRTLEQRRMSAHGDFTSFIETVMAR